MKNIKFDGFGGTYSELTTIETIYGDVKLFESDIYGDEVALIATNNDDDYLCTTWNGVDDVLEYLELYGTEVSEICEQYSEANTENTPFNKEKFVETVNDYLFESFDVVTYENGGIFNSSYIEFKKGALVLWFSCYNMNTTDIIDNAGIYIEKDENL